MKGGLKLHLGCGETYLNGYVNIDFPPPKHTVQEISRADVYADIPRLVYPNAVVDEIRLHHVFEHFDRSTALRLLMEWYAWLKEGGRLIIETPDFHRCVEAFLRSTQANEQLKILRHVFGSQEAGWAIHYDGWYEAKFRLVLEAMGYRDLTFSFAEWRGTYNITVICQKSAPLKSRQEQLQAAESLLRLSLVDDSPGEERMLGIWVDQLGRRTA